MQKLIRRGDEPMGHILVGESFVVPPADVTLNSGASHRPLRDEACYVKDSLAF
jgi:hypothetical protein